MCYLSWAAPLESALVGERVTGGVLPPVGPQPVTDAAVVRAGPLAALRPGVVVVWRGPPSTARAGSGVAVAWLPGPGHWRLVGAALKRFAIGPHMKLVEIMNRHLTWPFAAGRT